MLLIDLMDCVLYHQPLLLEEHPSFKKHLLSENSQELLILVDS